MMSGAGEGGSITVHPLDAVLTGDEIQALRITDEKLQKVCAHLRCQCTESIQAEICLACSSNVYFTVKNLQNFCLPITVAQEDDFIIVGRSNAPMKKMCGFSCHQLVRFGF